MFEDDIFDVEPEVIENGDGSVEVVFTEEEDDDSIPVEAIEHDANLAAYLPKEELDKLLLFCDDRYRQDVNSNSEFFDIIADGLSRLGMSIEEVTDPFPGASPVSHPIVLESALKTQAKLMGEIFSGKGLVDAYINAKASPELTQRANRVKKYMDFQYLHQMSEFIPETESLTFRFALTGNGYRKYFYTPIGNRIKTKYITENNFIINSSQTTIKDADFYTEKYTISKHEIQKLIQSGDFVDIFEDEDMFKRTITITTETNDIVTEIASQTGDAQGLGEGESTLVDRFSMREHHCYFEFASPFNDGEERAIPYVVTVEESTNRICSIRRNWMKGDPNKEKQVWFAHYKLIPGLGFHGLGYIHILGNFQFALTCMMRTIIDAGQFSTLQGGFRAKGIRIAKDGGVGALRMGEFREIDTHGKNIQDVIYPLQFKEPSAVLQAMFSILDGRVQKFADSSEQVISDSTNYGPVGTTMALLEASAKFMSGILKRFYNSLTEEFRILYRLNAMLVDQEQSYYAKGEENTIGPQDFMGNVEIVPQADPNISSSAHRIALAQTKLQAAQQAPDIHNLREAHREFYAALGMEEDEIDRLLPPPEEAQPQDPLTDIISASAGKPIKAFEGQDHDAHIRFKTAFLEDPQAGGSPIAASIVPLIQANIAEHTLLKYVARVKGAMQVVDQQAIGAEMAQAQAAELAAKVNTLENNENLLEAKDPAMLLALAEQENAAVRRGELEHKKAFDAIKLLQNKRDQDIKLMKIAKDADIDELEREARLDSKKLDLGAKMVIEALKDSKPKVDKNTQSVV